jgi:transposase
MVSHPQRSAKTLPQGASGEGGQDRSNPAANQPVLAARYDRELYGSRHLIENFFAKIKQFRAIATRYEKTARNFLAAVRLAASVV